MPRFHFQCFLTDVFNHISELLTYGNLKVYIVDLMQYQKRLSSLYICEDRIYGRYDLNYYRGPLRQILMSSYDLLYSN